MWDGGWGWGGAERKVARRSPRTLLSEAAGEGRGCGEGAVSSWAHVGVGQEATSLSRYLKVGWDRGDLGV